MKKLGILMMVLGLIASFLTIGCARPMDLSPAVNREFNITDFSKIEVGFTPDILVFGNSFDIPVELEVVKSANYKVNVLANENIFDYINVSKSGDTLKIKIDRRKIVTNEATLKAQIAMPEMEALKLSSGIMRASVFSAAKTFQTEVSGASKLNIDMRTGGARFKISSSSDVIVSGSAAEFRAEVSGSSTLKSNLKCETAIFTVSSSSDVISRGDVTSLEAEISGASTLDIDTQSPKVVLKLSSSSDVSGNLNVEELKIEASGASRVDLKGSARTAVLTATSSSYLILPDFPIKNARVILSGASEGRVNVQGILDVDLNSSSDLKYSGDPSMGEIKVNGASTIERQ